MAFQRSYSKVWWGSDNQLPGGTMNPAIHQMLTSSSLTSGGFYSYYNQTQQQQQQEKAQAQQPQYQPFGGSTYHSLDLHQYKAYGNLSRIQEVEDEHNASKLSWEKHDSPGSLRSQVSFISFFSGLLYYSRKMLIVGNLFLFYRILDFPIMMNITILVA